MGCVYGAPQEIKRPSYSPRENYTIFMKKENAYVAKIKEWAKQHGKGKYRGEEVRFHVADGYACYIVLSLSPLVLIHLDIGDKWQFPYVERLTRGDIIERVESQKSMARLFKNHERK